MNETPDVADVAIVGAGPYGLSLAAHLRASAVTFRIFGTPMLTWREHMPDGMLLKSDGFASNISDPASTLSLKRFCETTGVPYDDKNVPVQLETFRAYGLAFQQRLVPELEDKQVVRIEPHADGYRFELDDGGTGTAHNVVLAVGISHFAYVPPALRRLPAEYLSHSSAHADLGGFRGRDVTVIGGGASAIDIAALLGEAGARVNLIARRSSLRFQDPPEPGSESFWHRLRNPSSPIGPGIRSRLYTSAPGLFHRLPQAVRFRIVRTHVGPAAGWPMKERFVGRVPALLGYEAREAAVKKGQVHLRLSGPNGLKEHTTDHVIAATGYRIDLRRLTFLSADIFARIRAAEHTPVLSPSFESSVAGLYFVGLASAVSFGPMMRFACGAEWTSKRMCRRLAKARSRRRTVLWSGENLDPSKRSSCA
jgi:cation diffusion facilitator CzcD-associated flavoprotein CzcO